MTDYKYGDAIVVSKYADHQLIDDYTYNNPSKDFEDVSASVVTKLDRLRYGFDYIILSPPSCAGWKMTQSLIDGLVRENTLPHSKLQPLLGTMCYYIKEKAIKPAVSTLVISNGLDGCFCKKCNLFSKYSIPNQSDNSFVCYSCR